MYFKLNHYIEGGRLISEVQEGGILFSRSQRGFIFLVLFGEDPPLAQTSIFDKDLNPLVTMFCLFSLIIWHRLIQILFKPIHIVGNIFSYFLSSASPCRSTFKDLRMNWLKNLTQRSSCEVKVLHSAHSIFWMCREGRQKISDASLRGRKFSDLTHFVLTEIAMFLVLWWDLG